MKIIRLTTALDFGGQEKQYLSFTEHPDLLNMEYIFAAIGHGGYAEKELVNRGFEVKIFNNNPKILNLLNIWKLYQWFRKERPDIVHTAAAEANFHGTIAAKLAGVKIIIAEEIGLPNHSIISRKVFRQIYKQINCVICVSQAVKNTLISFNEIKESMGIVVYNPVSVPKILTEKRSDVFHLVYVGRLEKIKNVDFLINWVARLKTTKKIRLTIVGEGTERRALENLVDRYCLNDQIVLTGFLDKPESIVSQANLFVLPSLSEGFGIAVVEAMLQGIPCVCSNVGGIPEFIVDNENGWLFDPTCEESIDQKMNHILNLSIEEIKSIGLKGRNSVIGKFSIKRYVERIQSIYEMQMI